jgi:hypothetical protein
MLTINKTFGLFSKRVEQRNTKKTPAVTKVAACINAETGVGPSIASGNQICKPICADLPTTPQKNKKDIIVNLSMCVDKTQK